MAGTLLTLGLAGITITFGYLYITLLLDRFDAPDIEIFSIAGIFLVSCLLIFISGILFILNLGQ